MDTLRKPPERVHEARLNPAQQSRAHAIRCSLVHGLTLCALSRTEARVGSIFRADQALARAKQVAAQVSRELTQELQLSIPEQRHLYGLLNRLTMRIESVDPLWTLCGPADPAISKPLGRVA